MKVSYSMSETLKLKTSSESLEDLNLFIELVEKQRNSTSRNTHYDKLSDWNNPTYDFIRKMLNYYGFIQGEVEKNKLNQDASFWWSLYQVVSNITYSPLLETEVSRQHSSAYERNEALYKELLILRDNITK